MATTDADGLFVDTNVLVHANVAEAPLHQAALKALADARDGGCGVWTSRQVVREYLVVRTRPQTFASLPRNILGSSSKCNTLLEQECCTWNLSLRTKRHFHAHNPFLLHFRKRTNHLKNHVKRDQNVG